MDFLRLKNVTSIFNLKRSNQAIVEVAIATRKMSLRYSYLCGTASDAVDMVRSAIPQGFKLKILKSMDFLRLKNVTSIFNLKRSNQGPGLRDCRGCLIFIKIISYQSITRFNHLTRIFASTQVING
jgi:hypothetical protein